MFCLYVYKLKRAFGPLNSLSAHMITVWLKRKVCSLFPTLSRHVNYLNIPGDLIFLRTTYNNKDNHFTKDFIHTDICKYHWSVNHILIACSKLIRIEQQSIMSFKLLYVLWGTEREKGPLKKKIGITQVIFCNWFSPVFLRRTITNFFIFLKTTWPIIFKLRMVHLFCSWSINCTFQNSCLIGPLDHFSKIFFFTPTHL